MTPSRHPLGDDERFLRAYRRWQGLPAWRWKMPFRLARALRDRVYYRNALRARLRGR